MPNVNSETTVHNWNFAPDFPELPPNLIERPHLLQTIVEVLNGETHVLYLEGSEGDGATTTLAQFCCAYPSQSFSLFIKPASRFAYSLEYLRLALAEQFYWYVHGERLSKESLTESEFDNLKIKMLGKERGRTLYFVIDGLHQIPVEDRRVIQSIFTDLLPTGVGRCRLIVTGQQSSLAFPSFCASHIPLALPLLDDLQNEEADNALFAAAMMHLRHLPVNEPEANGKFDHSKSDAADVTDVIQMLHVARMDSTIFELMKCKVFVIASKPHLLSKSELTEEAFIKAWRAQSEQNPPETEIIALAYADNPSKHVLHDRWLLTANAGLRLGTSFNSLGEERLSEISEMDSTQVIAIEQQINKYLTRQRVIDGARIQYSGFTLY